MCDTIFTFSQRGGHFLQSPSKRDHTRLPKALQALLASNEVRRVYHVSLGCQDSFLITYQGKDGNDRIYSQDLPSELNDFLYAKGERNKYIHSIPNIRLTLGPYNESFFVSDGSTYLWMNLPARLLRKLQSRIENGAWTDKPRIVALGADDNFLLITEKHAAIWDLHHYHTLSQMLDYSRTQNRGIEEVVSVVLHPYRYHGFVAQSRNGTLLYENLPQWSMDGLRGMTEAIARDNEEAELKRKQKSSRRPGGKVLEQRASFSRKWDDKAQEFERKAKARGLKLSLSLTIGPGGIGFSKS